MATDHKNNMLQCQFCSKYYKNRDGLRKHLTSVHNNKTTIKCEQCPKSTFGRSDVGHALHVNLLHPKLDSKDGSGKLLCQICENSNESYKPTVYSSYFHSNKAKLKDLINAKNRPLERSTP